MVSCYSLHTPGNFDLTKANVDDDIVARRVKKEILLVEARIFIPRRSAFVFSARIPPNRTRRLYQASRISRPGRNPMDLEGSVAHIENSSPRYKREG